MFRLLLTLCIFTLGGLHAGPIGNFRIGNGALVKGEVMYADRNHYYCRKVSDHSETFTVAVEDVPVSFQRIINQQLSRGLLSEPPEDLRLGPSASTKTRWEYTVLDGDEGQKRRLAWVESVDAQGRPVRLIGQSSNDSFQFYIDFSHKMTNQYRWLVTYRIDGGVWREERWRISRNKEALFSPMPRALRDELLVAEKVEFKVLDMKGSEWLFSYDLGGFEGVHSKLNPDG